MTFASWAKQTNLIDICILRSTNLNVYSNKLHAWGTQLWTKRWCQSVKSQWPLHLKLNKSQWHLHKSQWHLHLELNKSQWHLHLDLIKSQRHYRELASTLSLHSPDYRACAQTERQMEQQLLKQFCQNIFNSTFWNINSCHINLHLQFKSFKSHLYIPI